MDLRTISSRSTTLRTARREARDHLGEILSDLHVTHQHDEDRATRIERASLAVLSQTAREGLSEGWCNAAADKEVPARWRRLFLATLDRTAQSIASRALRL